MPIDYRARRGDRLDLGDMRTGVTSRSCEDVDVGTPTREFATDHQGNHPRIAEKTEGAYLLFRGRTLGPIISHHAVAFGTSLRFHPPVYFGSL
jgi:hypothetical protein